MGAIILDKDYQGESHPVQTSTRTTNDADSTYFKLF